jgi:hypothetical protein
MTDYKNRVKATEWLYCLSSFALMINLDLVVKQEQFSVKFLGAGVFD